MSRGKQTRAACRYSESVTVKAWLKGHQFDLETLADLFSAGDVRVIKVGDEYCLTGVEMDSPPEGLNFYDVSATVLQRVNGIARTLRPNDYRPVELVGRYQVADDRHEVVQAEGAEVRERAESVSVVVATATLEARGQLKVVAVTTGGAAPATAAQPTPMYMALAAQHADVAETLALMGKGEPDWSDLYKVYEIVRDNLRPAKIEDKGWATKHEQSEFTGTANRPDVSGADARHARMPGGPPTHTMTLHEARQFIGDLVIQWVGSL